MILPDRLSFIEGSTALIIRDTPQKLTSNTSWHVSIDGVSVESHELIPALLTWKTKTETRDDYGLFLWQLTPVISC